MYRNLPTLLYRCMKQIQCSPYEWLVLYMNNVIKGQSAKVYRKMVSLAQPFSFNSFVKFHGKNNLEPQHDCVISKSVL